MLTYIIYFTFQASKMKKIKKNENNNSKIIWWQWEEIWHLEACNSFKIQSKYQCRFKSYLLYHQVQQNWDIISVKN